MNVLIDLRKDIIFQILKLGYFHLVMNFVRHVLRNIMIPIQIVILVQVLLIK